MFALQTFRPGLSLYRGGWTYVAIVFPEPTVGCQIREK